jgi:hypothetical protein
MKRDANIVGANSQKYIIMQNNFEFEIVFQIHKNRTCHWQLFYILWNALNYQKKKTCDVD